MNVRRRRTSTRRVFALFVVDYGICDGGIGYEIICFKESFGWISGK